MSDKNVKGSPCTTDGEQDRHGESWTLEEVPDPQVGGCVDCRGRAPQVRYGRPKLSRHRLRRLFNPPTPNSLSETQM